MRNGRRIQTSADEDRFIMSQQLEQVRRANALNERLAAARDEEARTKRVGLVVFGMAIGASALAVGMVIGGVWL